ncbi:MAG: hypothetical protein Kow0029_26740 [Candidatus Rifleibacteriota bacterium]
MSMAHSINYEEGKHGVTISLSGDVTAEELYKINFGLIGDKSFADLKYRIWDFSGAGRVILTHEQLRLLAIQDAGASLISPNQKIALVHKPIGNSGIYETFHAFEKAWTGFESRSFHDIDSAMKWIRK